MLHPVFEKQARIQHKSRMLIIPVAVSIRLDPKGSGVTSDIVVTTFAARLQEIRGQRIVTEILLMVYQWPTKSRFVSCSAIDEISVIADHGILTKGRCFGTVVGKVISVIVASVISSAIRREIGVKARWPIGATEILWDRRRLSVLQCRIWNFFFSILNFMDF